MFSSTILTNQVLYDQPEDAEVDESGHARVGCRQIAGPLLAQKAE